MIQYTKFIQNIGLFGITNIFLGLQGLILLPILTKTLSIEEYSIWVQIIVTLGLIPALVTLGLPYTIVRYFAAAKTRDEIREGFYSIITVVAVVAGIVSLSIFIFAELIANVLFDNMIFIVRILALLVFLECINLIQLSYFRTFQQIKLYSFLILFRAILQVLLAGTFVLTGYGLIGAVEGYVIASFILLLLMAIIIVFSIGIAIPGFHNLREYLSFGLPTTPANLSSWIVQSSDRYMIAILLGTVYVGYYNPAYSLGETMMMFMAPFSFLLPAVLSKYHDEENTSEVQTIMEYSLKYYLFLAIPSFLGISFLSKSILVVLTTQEIATAGIFVTPIVALSFLLLGVYTMFIQIIILEKKTKILGIIWMIAAAINFGLNILFIPIIGILGAALTTLISYTFALIVTLYYSLGYFSWGISWDMKKGIPCSIFASLCMVPILVLWNPTEIISIMLAILLCAVVYFTILIILKCITKEEILLFKNSIPGIKW